MKSILIGLAILSIALLLKQFLGRGNQQADLPALIRNGALLIDTRTAGEFSGGHIEGAINIPHNVIAQEIAQHETDTTQTIIVYCHSGARSAVARKALIQAGYTNVTNGGSLAHMRKTIIN